jgi:two-component system chemotaxis response regulator CheB
MRESGAETIGQDEATSLVYGMPRAAYECGGVGVQLPLGAIAERLLAMTNKTRMR